MKNSIRPAALRCLFTSVVVSLSAPWIHAQSPAISIDRTNYFNQTAASTVTPQAMPFSLNVHVRGGATNMANWGPALYIPGSVGVPQSGASSDTNTGTLNFPAAPNNGTDFMFVHDFASNAAMASFYPIAPTDGGAYGIKFLGSAPPSPALFTDGLVFAAGPTYPSVAPQITSANNGAAWVSNKLRINPTGTTTLTLNSFAEYGSTTYGSLIGAGIYNDNGVIGAASVESGYLPMGDSSESPDPIYQAPITQLTVDGSWFVPGQTYTLELQYSVIGGRPEEANLDGVEWQGVSTYRKVTLVTLGSALSSSASSDFNGDGKSDMLWQNTADGSCYVWFMNGLGYSSYAYITTMSPSWRLAGSGDFNGDGKADILWQNTADGSCYVWFMNGTQYSSNAYITTQSLEWRASTGDFNGDGKADILWSNTNDGSRYIWLMNGTTYSSYGYLATLSSDWRVAGTGDFNSDGKSDILWQNTADGSCYVWYMNGLTRTSHAYITTMASNWRLAGIGDTNGDGNADLAWRDTTTGDTYVWQMNGTSYTSYGYIANVAPSWNISN